MSLESNIRPDSPGSDERMQVEDDPTDTERAPYSTTIFKDTIQRYHQRTLSGSIANVLNVFDDADTLFWPSLAGHPGVEVSSVSREFSNAVDLPAEILCEIFIYLLPEEGWQGMCPPQLVVTQVCSYWRNVAIAYPRLWSTINIVKPTQRHIPMTRLWLERAAKCPLILYIDQDYRKQVEFHSATDSIIELLLPHAHRWKVATFKLRTGVQFSLLAFSYTKFPLLESLYFDATYLGRRNQDTRWTPDALRHVQEIIAPSSVSLRQLTWKINGQLVGVLSLPSTKLTHLRGNFTIEPRFLQLLSEMHNLQTLRLDACRQNVGSQPDTSLWQPIVLPQLHTLDLRIFPDLSQVFLALTTTPNLKVLSTLHLSPSEGRQALLSLIRRSQCELEAFAYDCAGQSDPFEAPFFSKLLSSMSALSELMLNVSDMEPISKILTRRKFPSLNQLILRGSFPGGLLLKMLKRRARYFPHPNGPRRLEPLFDFSVDFDIVMMLDQGIRLSTLFKYSLYIDCVEVTGSAHEVNELIEWCQCNARAHWRFGIPQGSAAADE
ncbi:hypothetical protein EV360DRAFT_65665 [Lentinula raphanica]|nr:hypothetical protein EV360DRAFT_65665 [Lentinula raphanica]